MEIGLDSSVVTGDWLVKVYFNDLEGNLIKLKEQTVTIINCVTDS